jgi:hypothetical protein
MMSKQQSPAERVIAAFGGNTATAQALGCNRSTVFRWTLDMDKGGTGGRVPSTRQSAILAKARELGVTLYAIDLVDQREVDEAGHGMLAAAE